MDEPDEDGGEFRISAEIPDWNRERPSRFWDPGRKLLLAIRRYQHWRDHGGAIALLACRWLVLRHRFWSAVTGAEIPLNCSIGGGLTYQSSEWDRYPSSCSDWRELFDSATSHGQEQAADPDFPGSAATLILAREQKSSGRFASEIMRKSVRMPLWSPMSPTMRSRLEYPPGSVGVNDTKKRDSTAP